MLDSIPVVTIVTDNDALTATFLSRRTESDDRCGGTRSAKFNSTLSPPRRMCRFRGDYINSFMA